MRTQALQCLTPHPSSALAAFIGFSAELRCEFEELMLDDHLELEALLPEGRTESASSRSRSIDPGGGFAEDERLRSFRKAC